MKKNKDLDIILEEYIVRILEHLAFKLPLEKIEIETPKEDKFGDLSTNIALKLARPNKQDPIKTADAIIHNLKKEIQKSSIKDNIAEIKNQNGFINFFFNKGYYYKQLREILLYKGQFGRSGVGSKKKVLIEFVSANPTGPLSVAHARQAAVGDILANILIFLGFRVKREYYLNDEGNQIDILGNSIELRFKELSGEKIEYPQNYYQGDYIYDIAKKISAKGGFAFGEKKEKSKSKNFSDYGVKYILKIIKKELADFGVRFDCWYSQKDLRISGKIEKVLSTLKAFLYEQDGALWFRSTQFKDDKDRVVRKSDGAYTYLAPDIAYHDDKYKRGFNWLINLWGPDHHGYINRLRAAVEALGKRPDTLSIIIVQLASIFKEGKPLEMSTRKGQYITLREVLDEVDVDAARFFFIMRRTSSHLDFDLEVAKKHTPENPVYYIQYAHARICSIINKIKRPLNFKRIDFNLLKEEEELQLLKTLSKFGHYLHIVLRTLDPYIMTAYLGSLAMDIHKFYDRHRVLVEDKDLRLARLALIEASRIILVNGLRLLGISRPKKM
jgi:arginyl-tRNA synthetase